MENKEFICCSVIIPNYNGRKFLDACLTSLKDQRFKNFEVILVDNASTDDSVSFVRSKFPWVKVIQSKVNLGFVGGCNLGANYAKGEYLVFLNNDTKIDPYFLEELIKQIKLDPSIGICGSKVLTYDGKKIDDMGFTIDMFGFPYNIEQVGNHPSNNVLDVFVVSGGAFLIKKAVWEKLGGFDTKFFVWGEITDLCWRARLQGYKIVTVPTAIVYHIGGGTTSKISFADRRYFSERNTLRTLLKNFNLSTLIKILPKYLGLTLAESIFFILIGDLRTSIAYIKAIFWNVKYFNDTWFQHKIIQQTRIIDDNVILTHMLNKSVKILQFAHWYKKIKSKGL